MWCEGSFVKSISLLNSMVFNSDGSDRVSSSVYVHVCLLFTDSVGSSASCLCVVHLRHNNNRLPVRLTETLMLINIVYAKLATHSLHS